MSTDWLPLTMRNSPSQVTIQSELASGNKQGCGKAREAAWAAGLTQMGSLEAVSVCGKLSDPGWPSCQCEPRETPA